MKQSFILFFKQRSTIIGILAAFTFQIVFSLVWMTGYEGVTTNIKKLKIALVNDDPRLGEMVIHNIQTSLPFETVNHTSTEEARGQLNKREVHLIIHIPDGFSTQLETGKQTTIKYILNESNPLLVRSVMDQVASTVTYSVNKSAVYLGVQGILKQMEIPREQIFQMTEGISELVGSEIEVINPVTSFSNQMVPLMMIISSFVGAMVMGMNMLQTVQAVRSEVGKWHRYIVWSGINIVGAIFISLVGTSIVIGLGAQIENGFFTMWGFQTLFVMAFLFLIQIILLLFGFAGMLFNIVLFSLQLVTSGAMVPRELLSNFYYSLGKFLPATYAVEGNMNILFGGPDLRSAVSSLSFFILAFLTLGVILVTILKDRKGNSASKIAVDMVK